MDSVTETVLRGTSQVADAIGSAADARERRKARARQAWEKVSSGIDKFASWADQKNQEDDLRTISETVSAASIGGDYQKALEALSQTPTKTALGAQSKLEAAYKIRAAMMARENAANERVLKQRELDLEDAKNESYKASLGVRSREAEAQVMKEALAAQAAEAENQARVEAYAPRQGVQVIPGAMGIPVQRVSFSVRPTDEQALAQMSTDPRMTTETFRKLREAVSKETDRNTDNTRLQEAARREAEQKDRDFELKSREQALKYGFKQEEFDWKKENEARKRALEDAEFGQKVAQQKAQIEYLYARLGSEIQGRYDRMQQAFIMQRINEIGKNYRGQMNQVFDPASLERLRSESEAAVESAIKSGLKDAQDWATEQTKKINAAGGTVTEDKDAKFFEALKGLEALLSETE